MRKKYFSKKELFLFSCLTILIFYILAETSSRIILCISNSSPAYLAYGFMRMPQKNRMYKIKFNDGRTSYYKSIPSKDSKNPVNSLGFRGPEVHRKKNKMLKRIVCLGGSTTYGNALAFDQTYPFFLQKKLNRLYGTNRYEVINAGQPGMTLAQIISFAANELEQLDPDIVLLMSINNNLVAPGYWFVGLKEQKDTKYQAKTNDNFAAKYLLKWRQRFSSRSAFFYLLDVKSRLWMSRFFVNFDWEGFSKALMRQDNIWQKAFTDNIDLLISTLQDINPEIKIFFLEQAVNTIRYPSLERPFGKAKQIIQQAAKTHKNIHVVDVYIAIIEASKAGKSVWQSPSFDPLHLSETGNLVLVDALIKTPAFRQGFL